MRDPRGHYLHATANMVSVMDARPAPWRPTLERDRFTRALELRQMLNEHHLPPELPRIPTRTIATLLAELDTSQARSASA
jgi:hypothetical protein